MEKPIESTDWSSDPMTAEILEKLRNGTAIDSRDVLRPVFKWTKQTGKHYNTNKALAFARWILKLQREGCELYSLAPQTQLNPLYVFNTLITMAQRSNDPDMARTAFHCIRENKFPVDVFTMTALIDTIGRNTENGTVEAFSFFSEMLSSQSTCLPNVVTFVTMFRLVGKAAQHTSDERESLTLQLLSEAQRLLDRAVNDEKIYLCVGAADSGQLDPSILDAAMSVAVRLLSRRIVFRVVSMIKPAAIRFTSQTPVILAKFTGRQLQEQLTSRPTVTSPQGAILVDELLESSLISSEQWAEIVSAFRKKLPSLVHLWPRVSNNEQLSGSGSVSLPREQGESWEAEVSSTKKPTIAVSKKKNNGVYAGCLGGDASESLRQSVIRHDLDKLIRRLLPTSNLKPKSVDSAVEATNMDCGMLSEPSEPSAHPDTVHTMSLIEADFATLTHQCRKRKWARQIIAVFDFVMELSLHGMGSHGVTPQPQLLPRLCLIQATFEAFFALFLSSEAWDLYERLFQIPELFSQRLTCDVEFITFLVKGFLHCGCSSRAALVFQNFRDELNSDKEISSEQFPFFRRVPPSPSSNKSLLLKLLHGLMRGLGKEFSLGLTLLLTSLDAWSESLCECKDTATHVHKSTTPISISLFITLMQSAMLLGHGTAACNTLCGVLLAPKETHDSIGPKSSHHSESKLADHYFSGVKRLLIAMITEEAAVWIATIIGCISCSDTRQFDSPEASPYQMLKDFQVILGTFEPTAIQVLPKAEFLQGLLAESLASAKPNQSQYQVSSGLPTLPFAGFLRMGEAKCLELRLPLIRHFLSTRRRLNRVEGHADEFHAFGVSIEEIRDFLQEPNEKDLEEAESYWQAAWSYRFEGAKQTEEETTASRDVILERCLLFCGRVVSDPQLFLAGTRRILQSNEGDIAKKNTNGSDACDGFAVDCCRLIAGMLAQHCHARVLQITDKNQKDLFSRHVRQAVRKLKADVVLPSLDGITGNTRWSCVVASVVICCILGTPLLQQRDKINSRFISVLFEELACSSRDCMALTADLLCRAVSQLETSVDYVRELHQSFGIFNRPMGRLSGLVAVTQTMKSKNDSLIRCMELVKLHRLLACSSRRLLRTIESIIISQVCDEISDSGTNSSSSSSINPTTWTAMTLFLTACQDFPSILSTPSGFEDLRLEEELETDNDKHCCTLEFSEEFLSYESSIQSAIRLSYAFHDRSRHLKESQQIVLQKLAQKLLVRTHACKLAEAISLLKGLSLASSSASEASTILDSLSLSEDSRRSYLPPSISFSRLYVIDDLKKLQFAQEQLPRDLFAGNNDSSDQTDAVLAIDCEWRPFPLTSEGDCAVSVGERTKVALLQLATRCSVYLFDLMICHGSYWRDESSSLARGRECSELAEEIEQIYVRLVQNLFCVEQSNPITLLGFGVENDLQRLRESYPMQEELYRPNRAILDFSTLPRRCSSDGLHGRKGNINGTVTLGLSGLCEERLGFPLNKSEQCSDWQSRPLTEAQIRYAAMDVDALIQLDKNFHQVK